MLTIDELTSQSTGEYLCLYKNLEIPLMVTMDGKSNVLIIMMMMMMMMMIEHSKPQRDPEKGHWGQLYSGSTMTQKSVNLTRNIT